MIEQISEMDVGSVLGAHTRHLACLPLGILHCCLPLRFGSSTHRRRRLKNEELRDEVTEIKRPLDLSL
jgi:hypothetical protein